MDSSRRTAIITGASSGLGVSFADKLAARGYDVVLVARRKERLEHGAQRLESRFGVKTTVLPLDLTDPQSWSELSETVPEAEVLVNNAGFASFADFTDTDLSTLTDQITLNCTALMGLTRLYLPGMVARDSGAIINIASTAAMQPVPTAAVYGATKAFVASFTTALWDEVKKTQVRVLTVCPGPTQTGFFTVAGDESVMRNRRTPDQVVTTALEALDKKTPLVVDGRWNRFLAVTAKFAPRRAQVVAARLMMKPSRH